MGNRLASRQNAKNDHVDCQEKIHCIKLDTAADKFYSNTLAVINMRKNKRMASIPNGVSSDVFLSINFPKFCFGDTLILTCRSMTESKTNSSQQSTSSATTINLSLSTNCNKMFSSFSSLFWTEPVVAVRDQATTGPPFKSASHRLSSKRSRSGIAQGVKGYLV